ncbi:MAG TPA: protein kinase, partial [Thermoanaerobaculia bacterium]|nr:protein kinase [Thermoanaerobaculia bacterium]
MTIAAGTRLGPYEILAPVGAGGMGEVYSARDTRLERSVAIKVLPAELSASAELKLRFEREARVVSGLNHPHICALYDVGQENGTDFLVMELCDGQSLADRLEKGPLPTSDVLRYAIQIAGALDRAHRSGVTHRDLKPGNIMLTKSGAKLLDFGLARHQGSGLGAQGSVIETQQKPITEQGIILGTFQYMAPEQLEGAEADARSDIFAFGSVLYEMITGKRAFEGATRASLIASILDREPRPISELQPLTPPALERVVRTCLNKDPDERWQNAHDLMRELEWIRDGISSPSALPAGRRGTARAWLPWTVAAVLAVVAAGAIWTAARQFGRREASLVSAIAPPADGQFIVTGDAAGPVTLSPDGRWAAYVAFNGNTTHLWVQSLESGNSQPLGGTERAMFPFWRPDSRSLGFFATGKLKIIDVDGLGLRVLADAADARGGTWGAGGDILFTPQTQGPIFRIAANGGPAAAVTVLETPITTHRWPEFLPDGRRFVFLAANHGDPTGAETAIFLGSVDGDPPRKVLPAPSHAVVHGDHLLYVQSNRLLAQRLGEGGLEGEPIRIRDNVLTDPGTWRSIFSVSKTGLLAYHPGGEALGSRLVWISRDGKELGEAPPRPLRDVSVSPRGDLLALTVGDPKSVLFIQ